MSNLRVPRASRIKRAAAEKVSDGRCEGRGEVSVGIWFRLGIRLVGINFDWSLLIRIGVAIISEVVAFFRFLLFRVQ